MFTRFLEDFYSALQLLNLSINYVAFLFGLFLQWQIPDEL